MTTSSPGAHRAPDADTTPAPDHEVERLQAHIEDTREDLARTVDQLASRVEAKARPAAAAVAGTVVGVVALLVVVAWRRRTKRG